jgi:hypothetical protein
MWLTLGIEVVLWAFMVHGPIWGTSILVPTAASLQFLSQTAHGRTSTLIAILRGHPVDTSGMDRLARITDAWHTILKNPLGVGWAGAGWVHSDFLQVAANLGVIAGAIFVLAYLHTLVRMIYMVLFSVRQRETSHLGLAILLSFLSAGGLLMVQGVEVLPQTALPVWFVWVIAEIWLQRMRQIGGMRKEYVSAGYLGSTANFQLRWDRPRHAGVGPMGG